MIASQSKQHEPGVGNHTCSSLSLYTKGQEILQALATCMPYQYYPPPPPHCLFSFHVVLRVLCMPVCCLVRWRIRGVISRSTPVYVATYCLVKLASVNDTSREQAETTSTCVASLKDSYSQSNHYSEVLGELKELKTDRVSRKSLAQFTLVSSKGPSPLSKLRVLTR